MSYAKMTYFACNDGLNSEDLGWSVVLEDLARKDVSHPRIEPYQLPLEKNKQKQID